MHIKTVTPRGFLSFGPETPALELKPLNILVGANGSGKSNFLEAIRFLQASAAGRGATSSLLSREGAGVGDWIWKGKGNQTASVEVVIADSVTKIPLRYRLDFQEQRSSLLFVDERLEEERPRQKGKKPYFYLGHEPLGVYLNRSSGKSRTLAKEKVNPEVSVLSVYNTELDYPENASMAHDLGALQFFSDPLFGRNSMLRKAQSTSLPRTRILEDGSNLALVLNRVLQSPGMRDRFTKEVQEVYPHVQVVETDTSDNRIQVLFVEKGWKTPASRLSDGTMRWVFLLALLLDPENRSPIFLDEPDLGLHPDALQALATLLKDASERTQIVVATHNVTLVDHFTENPEAVVVFDKQEDGATAVSTAKRLVASDLSEGMLLGEAWQRGLIGGNRW